MVRLFDDVLGASKLERMEAFHFVFTGGTYDRVVLGRGSGGVQRDTREFLIKNSTRLPNHDEGGVTVMAFMVVQRQISILWPFLAPWTSHLQLPDNLALLRLADYMRVKKLMNSGSVIEWFTREATLDADRNLQACPPTLCFPGNEKRAIASRADGGECRIDVPRSEVVDPERFEVPLAPDDLTIALIAHDAMKARMVDFARDFEIELSQFKRILSTGTTGGEVLDNTRLLKDKLWRYNSGPKGGDIEIATEILFGHCQVVAFFIDALSPHPHMSDIQVVIGAAMSRDEVRMLGNEMQAREWFERIARRF